MKSRETASRIIAVSKTVQIQPAVRVKLRNFKKRENMVPLILLVVLTVNNKLSFAAVALGKAEVHPGKALPYSTYLNSKKYLFLPFFG